MARIRQQVASAVALALISAAGSPAVLAEGQPRSLASPDQITALDALLAEHTSPTLPGCAVGVRGKGVDVTRAYGLADLERPTPLTVDSVFNIASASKQFTAAAVLLLAGDGRLKLEDDIRQHLPELAGLKQPITIDQLLTHTSGLRDFRFTDWVLGRDTLAQSNRDVLDFVSRQRALNHAPGESHSYTNTGYILLAMIVERVSGRSFQDFAQERLFKPAGMANTHWETDSQNVVLNRASGYAVAERTEDGKPARFAQMPTARNTYGHGNLLTTIDDIQRWNSALANRAFGEAVTRQLETPGRLQNGFVLDYARGEMVGSYRGVRQVQHGGYNGNYTAWVGRYPDIGLSVATLCNSDNDDVHPQRIVDIFLPKGTPPQAVKLGRGEGSTTDLSGHSGVYRRGDGQLAQLIFPAKAPMTGSQYVLGPYAYEFTAGKPGQVTRRAYGETSVWTRLPSWSPTPQALAAFQGHFDSDELLGGFEVAAKGQGLALSVVGLSSIAALLEPRAPDVFEARGAANLDGLLIEFKRDANGAISGLAVAPDSLHELVFQKRQTEAVTPRPQP